MSIPLVGLEEEPEAPVSAPDAAPAEAAQPAEAAAKAAPGDASAAETPAAPAEEAAAEPAEESTPETVGEKLHKMSAELTLRCVLSGILAVVLLHFGLTAAGLLAPIASLDPVVAPAAFYAANLLVLAAALAVAYPVLRDGLSGLKKTAAPVQTPCLQWPPAVRRWKPPSPCSTPGATRRPAGRCCPASRRWGCSWPCWAVGCSWPL